MQRRIIYFLIIMLLNFGFCYSQNNIHILKDISSLDTNFQDLQFLNKTLRNVEVVGLGEQSHYDGSTYEAKVRLIKYLHENLNFDVIAFESGIYDCNKANNEIQNSYETNQQSLFNAIFGVWHTKEVAELARYINETQSTSHPLILAGFDCQFSGEYSKIYFVENYFQVLQKIENKTGIKILKDTSLLAKALRKEIKFSNYYNKLPKEDTLLLYNNFSQFYEIAKKDSTREILKWVSLLQNMQIDYRRHFNMNSGSRDSMMAINILQLYNTTFKNKKLMLWSANTHLSFDRDYSKVKARAGVWIKQSLNDKYYCILTTSINAGYRIFFAKLKFPKIKNNSIESYLKQNNQPYQFIDFRKQYDMIPSNWLESSSVYGHFITDHNVSKITDGLLFIETINPPQEISK